LEYRKTRRFLALGLAITLSAGALPVLAQNQAPAQSSTVMPDARQPDAIIRKFSDTLQTVMRDAKRLQYAGRREALAPAIATAYHLPVMARIAVGTHWRKLSPAQQDRLVADFSRLTVATYANRFNGWSGETIEMLGVENVRDKTVLVKTAIVRPNKPPVEINYLMRHFEAGWKVIDIFLKESYSELATKRSEYSSVLRREGFDALIRQINEKVAQYERNPD
jgi:phospholipid transport system substrate-binding protein